MPVTSTAPTDFPTDVLAIRPWIDPVVDQFGHDPRSAYVERFWLGILGPSTVWLLRRMAAGLEDEPEGFTLCLPDTARALGIAGQGGRHSPFVRTLQRCCQFGMAELVRFGGTEELRVRRKLPPLTRRQLERLPEDLQLEHERWERTHATVRATDPVAQRERARSLALSLLELGEPVDVAEAQLHRWHFHPAVAHDALRWASEQAAAGAPGGEAA